ncbi:MAG: PAS domain-containing protein [Proteobacteria bacterium]|nr:PAS domain-containing protein [Pseudomonadota bacterium]
MQRFEHVKDERLRRLLAHWLQLRGDRAMPARQDLDPVAIYYALPFLWLYDFIPPEDFRCRLAGEQIIDLWGKNPKGRLLRDIFGSHAEEVATRFLSAVRTRSVMHTDADVVTTDRVSVRGERIVLPLSSDTRNVDAILGATIYDWGKQRAKSGIFAAEQHQVTYTAIA